jgi:hypothetical protein
MGMPELDGDELALLELTVLVEDAVVGLEDVLELVELVVLETDEPASRKQVADPTL